VPCLCGIPLAGRHGAPKKVPDRVGDVGGVGLERKMAGVEEMHFGVRIVALERLGAGRQKERIVLAPHREQRRLTLGKISLELGIEGDVAGIVEEEIELDLIVARAGKQRAVERVRLWRDLGRIGDPVGVLPLRRVGREERAQLLPVRRSRILPIALAGDQPPLKPSS